MSKEQTALERIKDEVVKENSAMSYTEGSETGGTDHWPGYAKEEKGTSSSTTVEPVPSEQEKQEEMWEEIKSKTEALVYAETDASQLEAEAIAISLCNAFKDKITITRK